MYVLKIYINKNIQNKKYIHIIKNNKNKNDSKKKYKIFFDIFLMIKYLLYCNL